MFEQKINNIQEALGRIETRQNERESTLNIDEQEFRVFSQWGEDGIIQFLVKNIEIKNQIFVEFGVESYLESNTRFLLVNNNWSGLVIDGSPDNIAYIKSDPIYWRYTLKAVCEFITKDNINGLLKKNGIVGDIGVLSIDIDGNDYWVWEAVNIVNPAIVIVEYNARFGSKLSVTVPYDPSFVRSEKHHSMIYFGASLQALCNLGAKKGYSFVGCCSAGVNGFFVRKDLMVDKIKEVTVAEGFVKNKFRESRDEGGQMIYLTPEEEQKLIMSMPLQQI